MSASRAAGLTAHSKDLRLALFRVDFYAGVLGLVFLAGCHVYDSELVEKGTHAPHAGTRGHVDAGEAGRGEGGAGAAGEGDEAGSGGSMEAGEGGGGAGGMLSAGEGGEGGEGGSGGEAGAGANGAGSSGAGSGGAGTGGGGGQSGTGGTAPCGPSNDCCPNDPLKSDPGICGCGTVDGACGCGAANQDSDGDGQLDCSDSAPYGWMRSLTLDGAQVTGALTNFPLLVRVTDPHLGTNALANGNDIYFTAADKTTLLDFEIERYTSASGALVAWVRIPSLAATTDAVIYLGYDDGKTNRSDATGLWSGYHNVWHLAQAPNGANSITDSTGAAHGTPQGSLNASSSVAGLVGQAITFDGNGDQIAFTNDITGSGPTTFSGWVNQADDSGDNGAGVVSIGNGSGNQARFLLSLAEQSRLKVGFFSNDDQPTTVLTLGSWSYLVWVWDGSQTTLYVNGASVLGPASHTGANTSGTTGRIGADSFGAGYHYYMTGQLDEVRIATATRTAAWVAAEYANQRPGATFIKNVGAAEAAPAH